MKKVLVSLGTRPEAIKLAPLINELNLATDFECVVCNTGQHKEMLDQVLDFFGIIPDYTFDIMEPNQTLAHIVSAVLKEFDNVLAQENPDIVVVQGDTPAGFASALAAFYRKIKIAHLEAGLRSGDIFSPFPEEVDRIYVSRITDFHFTPTDIATNNLIKEGYLEDKIYEVGNTVVDAQNLALDRLSTLEQEYFTHPNFNQTSKTIDWSKKIILTTQHRRENLGEAHKQIFEALAKIADSHQEVQIVFPVHLNPKVRLLADKILSKHNNIILINPLPYDELTFLMSKSYLIITDSGGIQEEAPSLKKPLLVTRENTERPEGVDLGVAKLVGSNYNKIIEEADRLLTDTEYYQSMQKDVSPYGDGLTSKKVINILR
ncbi:MAG: UDP-N-acetylglucosamine 2-epimerase (non-hydrolyzing) [Candidatus Ancillula sp.]|nr:UDP-N-acetylglucosamine 2-epimerase (non-hydrolyzing) [Candidatus Ancillula sp.]